MRKIRSSYRNNFVLFVSGQKNILPFRQAVYTAKKLLPHFIIIAAFNIVRTMPESPTLPIRPGTVFFSVCSRMTCPADENSSSPGANQPRQRVTAGPLRPCGPLAAYSCSGLLSCLAHGFRFRRLSWMSPVLRTFRKNRNRRAETPHPSGK